MKMRKAGTWNYEYLAMHELKVTPKTRCCGVGEDVGRKVHSYTAGGAAN